MFDCRRLTKKTKGGREDFLSWAGTNTPSYTHILVYNKKIIMDNELSMTFGAFAFLLGPRPGFLFPRDQSQPKPRTRKDLLGSDDAAV